MPAAASYFGLYSLFVLAPAPAPEIPPAPVEAGEISDEPSPLDAAMLDAPEDEAEAPAAPVATRPVRRRSGEELVEAIEESYAALYRPEHDPVRLNIAARVMFGNVSGRERTNGRLGGFAVDVGPAWNRVGVALTLTSWAGQVRLDRPVDTQLTAMLGAGPSIGLGRLALVTRGFIDLRAGYDVYYASIEGDQTQLPVPHGPRVRLDLGLLGSGRRRHFHGIGASLGYQRLLGSLAGELPATSLLTIGVAYWMG